ncbi:MAG: hypothetical protein WCO67_27345 [Betaproteobacteria bacterium]
MCTFLRRRRALHAASGGPEVIPDQADGPQACDGGVIALPAARAQGGAGKSDWPVLIGFSDGHMVELLATDPGRERFQAAAAALLAIPQPLEDND